MTRREFFKASCAFGAGMLITPSLTFAQSSFINDSIAYKRLNLYNVNTKETLQTTFFSDGQYLPDALSRIDTIMGDRRSGEITNMDRRLIDALHTIHTLAGSSNPIKIICGYRSERTNATLTHTKRGVAKKSYHTLGQAVDISIDGVPLERIRQIAQSLKIGGVGYYPASGFVHIDVGPLRSWRG